MSTSLCYFILIYYYHYLDSCDQWIQCKYHSLRRYLKQLENLPSCPCVFPNLMWHNQLWDKQRESYFTWEIASSPAKRRDIYRPGAKFCIRSLLEPGMLTLAVQHCCYDVKQRLITRGRAAGTPNLISPQISWELHKKVDILPWVLCKGDWLRFVLCSYFSFYCCCFCRRGGIF